MTEPDDFPVPSPCRKQCQLHPIDRVCLGCFRTIDEISDWARLDNPTRARIVGELPARRTAWEKTPRRRRF